MKIELSLAIQPLFSIAWSVIPDVTKKIIEPQIILVFDDLSMVEKFVADSPIKDRESQSEPPGWCIPTSNPDYGAVRIYLSKKLNEFNPVQDRKVFPEHLAIYFILHELAHAFEITEAFIQAAKDPKINLDNLASVASEVRADAQALVWALRAYQLQLEPSSEMWRDVLYEIWGRLKLSIENGSFLIDK